LHINIMPNTTKISPSGFKCKCLNYSAGMAALYDLPTPDCFVVGTIGLPAERTFLLQAKSGNVLTTVVVEKEQVKILADRITELLDMVMIKDPAARVPQTPLHDRIDTARLNVPIEPEFRVGT